VFIHAPDLLRQFDHFLIAESPNAEWGDRDGDHVWDGIDGAPDDPKRGYLAEEGYGEDPFAVLLPCLGIMVGVAVVAIIILVVVVRLMKRPAPLLPPQGRP
jgi:hypothetical protein